MIFNSKSLSMSIKKPPPKVRVEIKLFAIIYLNVYRIPI